MIVLSANSSKLLAELKNFFDSPRVKFFGKFKIVNPRGSINALYEIIGPEIFHQTEDEDKDVFITETGTSRRLMGVGRFLKKKKKDKKVVSLEPCKDIQYRI